MLSTLVLFLSASCAIAGKAASTINRGLKPIRSGLPSRVVDKTTLGWTFDAKTQTFYLPESLDITFEDDVADRIPFALRLGFKKLEKYKYDKAFQVAVGKLSTGRFVMQGTDLALIEYRVPVDFATVDARLHFPEVEPEIAVTSELSPRSNIKALFAPLSKTKKLLDLAFNFDIDSKTTLGIQPQLNGKRNPKFILDRKTKNAKVSASLLGKTATLAATISGLKPSIGINLDDPLSKPTLKLSYELTT